MIGMRIWEIGERLLEVQTTSLGFEDSIKTYSIDWHPDGNKIAFGLGANIYVTDLLGQNTLLVKVNYLRKVILFFT